MILQRYKFTGTAAHFTCMSHWKANVRIDIEELAADFFLIRGNEPKRAGTRISYLKKQCGGNLLFHRPDVRRIYTGR